MGGVGSVGVAVRRDGHERRNLRVMQHLVRVAYALATHEECAVVGVASYCCINSTRDGWDITIIWLSIYLPISRLPTVLNILRIRFFGLNQCAQLQAGQHQEGDGLLEEAGESGGNFQRMLK